jgi:S-adenosylmethionine:diacylglycerol 3-amino-3-carboxypropyl transferase
MEMTNKELRKLIDSSPSYDRDKKLRAWQNKFILKSGISRRLFDVLFQRCSKRKSHGIERRLDMMDRKKT